MRCLVVGCGSIGSRRARILADMGHEVSGWDASDAVMAEWPYGTEGPNNWADVVLVCTPPLCHIHDADTALCQGAEGVFMEKPFGMSADGLDRLIQRTECFGATTMGACNLRFDRRVQANEARIRDAHHVIFRMGQHARHWNPAHKPIQLALDSIHELDLAIHLRGEPTSVTGHSNEDEARIDIVHEDGRTSYIHLDRYTDPPERYIQFPDNSRVDLWPPDEEMYRREMQHFLDCVEDGRQTCNPLEQAADTLRWALKVCETEGVRV